MALQACHECGDQVSTEALSCPSCGAPVRQAAQSFGQFVNKAATGTATGEPITLPGWAKASAWVLGSIFLVAGTVAAVGAIYSTPQTPAPPTSATATPTAPLQVERPARTAHNYSRLYGNFYGYPVRPNLRDRQQGITPGDLQPVLVRFDGDDGTNVHFFMMAPGGMGVGYECPRPFNRCDTTAGAGWTDVAPGTILEAVLQDSANGYLHVQPAPRMPVMPPQAMRAASGA